MRSKENKNNLTADQTIDVVYDYFKSRYPVFPLSHSFKDVLYDCYDSYEGRSYTIGMEYSEFLKVGSFLITKGIGYATRLSSVGNCLLVIPMKKCDEVDNFSKVNGRIKTRNYSALFGYRGKLHSPYQLSSGVNQEISFVLASTDEGFTPNAEIGWVRYYTSKIDCYDANFVDNLITAFKCKLGIKDKKTKKLSQEAEIAYRKHLLKKFPKEDVHNEINSLIRSLDLRINSFGETEFIPILEFLRSEVSKISAVADS